MDIDLQKHLFEHVKILTPLPSFYLPEFIADNQAVVADKWLARLSPIWLDQSRGAIGDQN